MTQVVQHLLEAYKGEKYISIFEIFISVYYDFNED